MKKVYFINQDGTVTVSNWGLFGGLKSFSMLRDIATFDGTVIYGGRGEVSVQTLPAVPGRPGWEMVQRKVNEFAGTNPLAVMTAIEHNKADKTFTWRFAQMFCDIRHADLRWWMMTIENMAIHQGWGNKILHFEIHGKKHLAVFANIPHLIGYHGCSDDDEDDISRVIQSWRGKRMGLDGIVTIGCEWPEAVKMAWSDIGESFGLDKATINAHPEILLCHPKMVRFSGNWATDSMRKETKQKKVAGFFYASALLATMSSFWLAGSLYSNGLKAQDQAFGFERERQEIAAKLDIDHADQSGHEAFLKASIKAASEVDLNTSSLQDAFQVIQSANFTDEINLDKLIVKPTAEQGVSDLRIAGTIAPVVSNGHGKIYSSTLKFLKGC